jgi:cytochrome c-type biogenesis protein CcmE
MKKQKRIGMVVGLLIVLSAFGYLIYGGIGENLVYFVTPGELLAQGTDAYDRPVRLGGLVMPGSHTWDADKLDLQFTLQDQGGTVRVHSRKVPPPMFREGQGVIVEGKMTRAGVFEASNVMVKHSNEYRPPADGHVKPEEMYKSLIRDSN